MKPTIIIILSITLGLFVGSLFNMGILLLGMQLIPAPAGVDVMNPESLQNNIHLFQFQHFIFPFLAHAFGTLSGAILILLINKQKQTMAVYILGALFLIAGIFNVVQIPAPIWFDITDLVLAYLPMSWLALQTPFYKGS